MEHFRNRVSQSAAGAVSGIIPATLSSNSFRFHKVSIWCRPCGVEEGMETLRHLFMEGGGRYRNHRTERFRNPVPPPFHGNNSEGYRETFHYDFTAVAKQNSCRREMASQTFLERCQELIERGF